MPCRWNWLTRSRFLKKKETLRSPRYWNWSCNNYYQMIANQNSTWDCLKISKCNLWEKYDTSFQTITLSIFSGNYSRLKIEFWKEGLLISSKIWRKALISELKLKSKTGLKHELWTIIGLYPNVNQNSLFAYNGRRQNALQSRSRSILVILKVSNCHKSLLFGSRV